MADLSQLESALMKADAAGAEDDARALAAEIRRMRAAPVAEVAPPQQSSEGGGVLGGVLQGLRDPIDAGAQILSNIVPEGARNAINQANNYLADKTGLVGRLPEGGVDEQIKQNEQKYQSARQASGREGFDAARMAGNVGASLPLAFAPGMQMAAGKGILDAGNIARGAAQGAVMGGLQPVTEGDFGDEKLGQVAQGAAFGGVSAPIGAAIGRMLSPQTSGQVKALMNEGVTPTPGQILGGTLQRAEDKAMSIPVVGDAISAGRRRATGDLNRAAYARALKGMGVDAKDIPVGREGVAFVKDTLGQAYDDLLPKLSFKPDQKFASDLTNLKQMASNLAPTEAKRFDSILNEHMSKVSPNGSMNGETYKILESSLANDIKKFSGATDAYQRELGDALKETLNVFRQGLERSNPKFSKELSDLNRNYANYTVIRNAGARAGDQSGGFSPAQLAAAVRTADKTAGKGGTATGRAMMQGLSDAGTSVLNSKYPDSGTIGRGLFAGGLGAAAYAEPTLLAAGLGALPYTASGQKIMAALLTQRPSGAKALSRGAQKLAPLVGGALAQPLSN